MRNHDTGPKRYERLDDRCKVSSEHKNSNRTSKLVVDNDHFIIIVTSILLVQVNDGQSTKDTASPSCAPPASTRPRPFSLSSSRLSHADMQPPSTTNNATTHNPDPQEPFHPTIPTPPGPITAPPSRTTLHRICLHPNKTSTRSTVHPGSINASCTLFYRSVFWLPGRH